MFIFTYTLSYEQSVYNYFDFILINCWYINSNSF